MRSQSRKRLSDWIRNKQGGKVEKVVEVDRVRGKGLGQQEPLPLKEPAAPGLLRTRPSSEQRCWSGPFSRPRFPERLSQSSVCVCAGGGFPLTRSCLRSAGAGGSSTIQGKRRAARGRKRWGHLSSLPRVLAGASPTARARKWFGDQTCAPRSLGPCSCRTDSPRYLPVMLDVSAIPSAPPDAWLAAAALTMRRLL